MSHPTPVKLKAHHGYQSWTTDWRDEQGHRRTKRFGKESELTAREAAARFQFWLISEWHAKPHVRCPEDPGARTVRQIAEAFADHVRTYYVKNGRPTTYVEQVETSMKAFVGCYGDAPASSVSGPTLARLRNQMIIGSSGRPRARKTVNGMLGCIKASVKWARAGLGQRHRAG